MFYLLKNNVNKSNAETETHFLGKKNKTIILLHLKKRGQTKSRLSEWDKEETARGTPP